MSTRYPYHLKRADIILESMRRYPHCDNDRDRADMSFDRELLAQHLADIEGAAADQGAPRETVPKPQCDGSCGSLFCGAIYGRKPPT